MISNDIQVALAVTILCLCRVGTSEVIYERPLTDAEKEKYEIREHVNGFIPPEMTYEQAKALLLQQAKAGGPHGPTLKVVLEKDPTRSGRLICYATKLGQRKDFLAAQSRWQEEGPKRLGIASKVTQLKHRSTTATIQEWCDVFVDNVRIIYVVNEHFWEPKQGVSTAIIYEVREHTIPPHELLRALVKSPCRTEATSFGTVVVSEPAPAGGHRRGVVGRAWLSGDHHLICIRSEGVMPEELLQLYGKKYPSRLPKGFSVDKTKWAREEMELWLARLGRYLNGKDWREYDNPISGADWFSNYLEAIESHIWVPFLEARDPTGERPKGAERKALYERLVVWWGKYKDKTHWDDKVENGRLVATGQTPPDIARVREKLEKDREARELAAALEVPLTKADVQEFENKLKAMLNSELEREAAALANAFTDGKTRVKLQRLSEDKWVLTFPNQLATGTITRTYSLSKTTRQDDKAKPLKVVLVELSVDSANPADKTETKRPYIFYKIAGRWAAVY